MNKLDRVEIIESPFVQIVADLAKNNKNLTPDLQNAIAQFISVQSAPIMKIDASDLSKVTK